MPPVDISEAFFQCGDNFSPSSLPPPLWVRYVIIGGGPRNVTSKGDDGKFYMAHGASISSRNPFRSLKTTVAPPAWTTADSTPSLSRRTHCCWCRRHQLSWGFTSSPSASVAMNLCPPPPTLCRSPLFPPPPSDHFTATRTLLRPRSVPIPASAPASALTSTPLQMRSKTAPLHHLDVTHHGASNVTGLDDDDDVAERVVPGRIGEQNMLNKSAVPPRRRHNKMPREVTQRTAWEEGKWE